MKITKQTLVLWTLLLITVGFEAYLKGQAEWNYVMPYLACGLLGGAFWNTRDEGERRDLLKAAFVIAALTVVILDFYVALGCLISIVLGAVLAYCFNY